MSQQVILTDVEERFVEAVRTGEPLDLLDAGSYDESAMVSWGQNQAVRAKVLRDLVLGKYGKDMDPWGVQLRGAKILGNLELRYVSSEMSIYLVHCFAPDGIDLRDARFRAIDLQECRVNGVGLSGAHLGSLSLDGSIVNGGSGPAVFAEDSTIDQGFSCAGSTFTGAGEGGVVRLTGARIGGRLTANGAAIKSSDGCALLGEDMKVGAGVSLGGVKVDGAGIIGAIRLFGAEINGQLILSNAVVSNGSGPAVVVDSVKVKTGVFMRSLVASGAESAGAVRFNGAQIGGQLVAGGASIVNKSGPAFVADGMHVGDGVHLNGGFSAHGNAEIGSVRLSGAQITGQLSLGNSYIRNSSGPAVVADRIRVSEDLELSPGFKAFSHGPRGAVQLDGADIGGKLNAEGARIRNSSGPALVADSMHVSEGVLLRNGFRAVGNSKKEAAVRMVSARIDGPLELGRGVVENNQGTAITADGMKVSGDLDLSGGFLAVGNSEVVIRLFGVQVAGRILVDPSSAIQTSRQPGGLLVEGMTYSGLPMISSVKSWLSVLANRTPQYSAQPYRHLAAAAQSAGHDSDVRKILVAQRRDQINRNAVAGRSERFWARVTGVTLGYGYQPWRALFFLAGFALLAVGAAIWSGSHGGLVHTEKTGKPGRCSSIERVGVGLDLSVPLIKTGARDVCAVTTSTVGQVLTAGGWVLQLGGWATTTLFVAGFTGAVRKS